MAKFSSTTLPNLAALGPAFIDVTYGAGGGSGARESTLSLCEDIQTRFGVPAVMHLTCRGANQAIMHGVIRSALSRGVCNVLALRGDAPEAHDATIADTTTDSFVYAADLVGWLRANYGDELGVGVAAYPERHPEAPTLDDDIARLQDKVAAGADVCVTQFFLDPQRFLAFRDRLKAAGGLARGAQVVPGIIMVNSYQGLQRMLRLSGNTVEVPKDVTAELERLRGDQLEVQAFGVRLAASICRALYANGERFFHIYSLNIDHTCRKLVDTLGWIAKPEYIHTLPNPVHQANDGSECAQQQQHSMVAQRSTSPSLAPAAPFPLIEIAAAAPAKL